MAYKYKKLEKQAVDAIEKYKLFFIADVVCYLPCSSSTFYDKELEKSEAIKEALTKEKTQLKVSMRRKWYLSNNATLQMGLMKLLSSDKELKKLAMQYTENKTHNLNQEITAEEVSTISEALEEKY